MAYTHFDRTSPEPTQSGTEVCTSARENFAALQDAIIITGAVPQWDAEAQDVGGGTPPTDPTHPEQIVYSKGTERVKAVMTWSSDIVTAVAFSYSSNSGVDYDSMGTMTITYDGSDNYVSHAWS